MPLSKFLIALLVANMVFLVPLSFWYRKSRLCTWMNNLLDTFLIRFKLSDCPIIDLCSFNTAEPTLIPPYANIELITTAIEECDAIPLTATFNKYGDYLY
jgi:hypothetical protein